MSLYPCGKLRNSRRTNRGVNAVMMMVYASRREVTRCMRSRWVMLRGAWVGRGLGCWVGHGWEVQRAGRKAWQLVCLRSRDAPQTC